MFNPDSDDLLKLQPIAEPVDIDIPPEPVEEKPITQNEIFNTGTNIKVSVEEGVMTNQEVNAWGKPKLRGVGKRGKDKKPRKKKPPSEKQLAHLARMRKMAAQKRAAVALEKKRKKEEAKRIQKELEALKPTPIENTKVIKRAILKPPPPAPVPPPPKKKVHFSTNTPRISQDKAFFALMDRYEKYKEAKNIKIKKEKSLQERLNEKRRNKPHPNCRIPQIQRPQPPNPYDDIFNYKGHHTFH